MADGGSVQQLVCHASASGLFPCLFQDYFFEGKQEAEVYTRAHHKPAPRASPIWAQMGVAAILFAVGPVTYCSLMCRPQ
jgi:hypothetical protein